MGLAFPLGSFLGNDLIGRLPMPFCLFQHPVAHPQQVQTINPIEATELVQKAQHATIKTRDQRYAC